MNESAEGRAKPPRRRRLIYIGGYGRSGSTLLGRIMARRDEVLDLGEVVRTARRLKRRRHYYCTCGQPLKQCSVWRRVRLPADWSGRRNVDRAAHLRLLEQVMARTRRRVIVDSSKTAHRQAFTPGYLKRHIDADFTMVHLVRDPRGVVWSVLRDRDRKGLRRSLWWGFGKAFKVSAAWLVANLAAEWYGIRHHDSYVRVRYEDAMRFGIPALAPLVPRKRLVGRTLRPRHNNHHAVAGNRMRYEPTVRIRFDEDWREQLPASISALVSVVSFPLLVRYRFLGRGEPRRPEPTPHRPLRTNR